MELKQLWAVVTRRWWLVLLPTLVTLVLALPTLPSIVRPPAAYNAIIRFTASQPPSAEMARTFEDQSYIPWLTSEYVIINLAGWVRTESFASEVANILKAQAARVDMAAIDADAIRGAIAADSVRSIMTLYLQNWPDAAQLEQIAAAAVTALRERSQDYFPQLAAQRVIVMPLDAVTVTPAAAPLTARLSPLLRVLIGLAAGLGLAFLADYLDPTIRSRREIEALDLPVIAEIPNYRA